jgi:hypothetical protein
MGKLKLETKDGLNIVVMGPYCWGHGRDIKTAKRNCRREAPSKGSTYYPKDGLRFCAWLASDDFEISGMGYITATTLHKLGEC